jgi:WD40 repeat protein
MRGNILLLYIFFSISCIGYSQKENAFVIFKTDNKTIYDICFTNKGAALGIADGNNIKIYSIENNRLIGELSNEHTKQILSLDISTDSTILVSGGKDSTIVVWDLPHGRLVKKLKYHQGIVISAKISPDNRLIASGGSDKNVFVYDIDKNEVRYKFSDQKDDITSVAFSQDSHMLAAASGDGSIIIYDLRNGKIITKLSGQKKWTRAIKFNNDGTKLISGGDYSNIYIYYLANPLNIQKDKFFDTYFNWILGIDFFTDDQTYAYCGLNGKAVIITPYAKYISKIKVPVNKVYFMPNERSILKIAIATMGKGVMLIDTKDMKLK